VLLPLFQSDTSITVVCVSELTHSFSILCDVSRSDPLKSTAGGWSRKRPGGFWVSRCRRDCGWGDGPSSAGEAVAGLRNVTQNLTCLCETHSGLMVRGWCSATICDGRTHEVFVFRPPGAGHLLFGT
jgi:hypothetical protein